MGDMGARGDMGDAGALVARVSLLERELALLRRELDVLRRELALLRVRAPPGPLVVQHTYHTSVTGPSATVFACGARVADVSCDKRRWVSAASVAAGAGAARVRRAQSLSPTRRDW